MDLEKLLTFVTQNLAEYYMVFVATLVKPAIRFRPVSIDMPSSEQLIEFRKTVETGSKLNPKLLSFVVISIFLGVTVNALIPNRKNGLDLASTTIIVLGCWFLYSTTLHWFCTLLKGKGSYLETLSISVQLLSVLYVLSSFLSFSLSAILQVPQINDLALKIGGFSGFITLYPVTLFFLIQALLLTIYLPIAIRYVHHFGWFKQVLVAVLSIFGTLLSIRLYLSFGVLLNSPM